MVVPQEFEEYADQLSKLTIGDTIRLCHKYRADGSPCSLNKDNAMMITKYHGHYYFYCHRCHLQGKVVMAKTPQQLAQENQRKIDQAVEREERLSTFSPPSHVAKLPVDCVLANHESVPAEAKGFLNKYSIDETLVLKYTVQFSRVYDRIIFPIRKEDSGIIIGWAGRCYHDLSKEERIINKRPKWLTRKINPADDRIFWSKFNPYSKGIVLVEDIISAIRVHEVTNVSTIALLTTSLPDTLLPRFRGKTVVLWLDGDMQGKMFQYVRRLNTLGIKGKMIYSKADPKLLPVDDIKTRVFRKVQS